MGFFTIRGHSKKAVQELQKQVEASPQDSRLRLKLGDSYLKNGDSENAIKEYLKVAELYEKEDLNTKAISIYKKILSLNSDDTEALHRIARLYIQEGLEGSARNCYLTILKIRSDDTEAQSALEEIDRSSRRTEPMKHPPGDSGLSLPSSGPFSPPPSSPPDPVPPGIQMEAPSSPPKDYEMHYHLGIAYREMELYDYAITEFEQAGESADIRFDCLIMLGTCYQDKGDCVKSIEYFKQASELKGLPDGKLARLYFNLGTAYETNGMIPEAIDNFKLALRLDGSLSEAQQKIETLQTDPK